MSEFGWHKHDDDFYDNGNTSESKWPLILWIIVGCFLAVVIVMFSCESIQVNHPAPQHNENVTSPGVDKP
jgi:hypothetical protein